MMVVNLKPGYYHVLTMAPLKVKSLKSLFALQHLKTQFVTRSNVNRSNVLFSLVKIYTNY